MYEKLCKHEKLCKFDAKGIATLISGAELVLIETQTDGGKQHRCISLKR
jgi:hypothetical protein